MENEKIAEEQCPKCKACGVTEKRRQWEPDGFSECLVAYYECQSCHHEWKKTLDTRRRPDIIEVTPDL